MASGTPVSDPSPRASASSAPLDSVPSGSDSATLDHGPDHSNGQAHERAHERAHEQARGVEPDIRAANLARLRRIEGQVRGIQKMVEDDRYCPDILVQIASVREALMGVSRELMRNHLTHCAAEAAREEGDAEERMRGELLDLIFRYLR